MRYTFGITTDYTNKDQLIEVFKSIEELNIPEYEILVVGGEKPEDTEHIKYIQFDETQKPGWTTRKKNIIAQSAQYENVILMHDYYVFDKNWYINMVEFSQSINWDICSCQQLLITGKRHFTDWVVWDDPIFLRYSCLPYDEWTRVPFMYISGGFIQAKKQVLIDNPFNEELMHGQSEDVEWSLRVRNKYRIVCNGGSIVKHNKWHRDAK
jgi:GT2 family glycosyltransferase